MAKVQFGKPIPLSIGIPIAGIFFLVFYYLAYRLYLMNKKGEAIAIAIGISIALVYGIIHNIKHKGEVRSVQQTKKFEVLFLYLVIIAQALYVIADILEVIADLVENTPIKFSYYSLAHLILLVLAIWYLIYLKKKNR